MTFSGSETIPENESSSLTGLIKASFARLDLRSPKWARDRTCFNQILWVNVLRRAVHARGRSADRLWEVNHSGLAALRRSAVCGGFSWYCDSANICAAQPRGNHTQVV